MRKYKIRAQVIERFDPDIQEQDYIEEVVFADDPDEATTKFIMGVRENNIADLEIDDITIEDLGAPTLFLSFHGDSYSKDDQIKHTITVSELMDILGEYDPDSPIMLVNYAGFTPVYGIVNEYRLEEEKDDDEN